MDKNDCIALTHTHFIELSCFYSLLKDNEILDEESYSLFIEELGEDIYG
ncbi:MAG: hypothetical protein ACRDD8_05260 [Bacteroidales bacterium]